MRILNIGSINADHVYRVEQIARPGETRASRSYARYAGGKGFNQSVALARAGAAVVHVGGAIRLAHGRGRKVVLNPAPMTPAGDTFVGYFLAAWTGGVEMARALRWACRASSICVTRPGAAVSIPRRAEVGEP